MKNKKLIKILNSGGVAVIPTDTLYGIVGSALRPKTVARIYKLRKRNLKKPMIILIGSTDDLKSFGINTRTRFKFWPGKVSVVLSLPVGGNARKFAYLHRGTKTLAFRLPKPKWLRELLKQTGPLVAPSANIEGEFPAFSIKKAKKYFGGEVDLYMNAGKKISDPSTVVKIERGKFIVLRPGAVRI